MIEKVRRSGRKAMDVRKNGLQFSLNRINWMLRATSYGRRSETRKGTKKEPVDATHLQVPMLLTSLTTGYVSGA